MMQGHPKCPSAVVSFSSCGCPNQPGAARSRRVPLRAGGRGLASPVGLGDVACSRWGLDLQPPCFQDLSLARSFWALRWVTGCHLALPTAVFASLPEARGDDWVSSRGCSVLSSPRPPRRPLPPPAPEWVVRPRTSCRPQLGVALTHRTLWGRGLSRATFPLHF